MNLKVPRVIKERKRGKMIPPGTGFLSFQCGLKPYLWNDHTLCSTFESREYAISFFAVMLTPMIIIEKTSAIPTAGQFPESAEENPITAVRTKIAAMMLEISGVFIVSYGFLNLYKYCYR